MGVVPLTLSNSEEQHQPFQKMKHNLMKSNRFVHLRNKTIITSAKAYINQLCPKLLCINLNYFIHKWFVTALLKII